LSVITALHHRPRRWPRLLFHALKFLVVPPIRFLLLLLWGWASDSSKSPPATYVLSRNRLNLLTLLGKTSLVFPNRLNLPTLLGKTSLVSPKNVRKGTPVLHDDTPNPRIAVPSWVSLKRNLVPSSRPSLRCVFRRLRGSVCSLRPASPFRLPVISLYELSPVSFLSTPPSVVSPLSAGTPLGPPQPAPRGRGRLPAASGRVGSPGRPVLDMHWVLSKLLHIWVIRYHIWDYWCHIWL